MIDRVLSDRDEERRVLFEEASGISKYKKYRDETKRQLDRTSLDLERVEDNLRHTKQSVKMFERQARKAEKWHGLQDRVKSLELSYQSDNYSKYKLEVDEVSAELESNISELEEIKTRITSEETSLETEKLKILGFEKNYSEKNQIVSNKKAEGERCSNEIRIAQERVKFLNASLDRKDQDLHTAKEKIAGYVREREELLQIIEDKKGILEDKKRTLEEETKRYEEIQTLDEANKASSHQLTNMRITAIEELSRTKREFGELQTESTSIENQLNKLQLEGESLRVKEESLGQEVNELQKNYEDTDRELQQDHIDLENKQSRQSVAIKELSAFKDELRILENEKVTLETKAQMLKSACDLNESSKGGTKYLLDQQPEKLHGSLFDFITVPQEYISLVDIFLGEALQTLIVKDNESVTDIIQVLQDKNQGSAAMYPSRMCDFKKIRTDLSEIPGFSMWLIDVIDIRQDLRGLLEHLIGNYALTDNIDSAFKLSLEYVKEDIWFATPDGSMLHTSGITKGGSSSAREKGLLLQRNELEKTTDLLNTVEKAFEKKQTEVEYVQNELEDLTQELHDLQHKTKDADTFFRELSGKLAVVRNSINSMSEDKHKNSKAGESLKEKYDLISDKMQPIRALLLEKESYCNSIEEKFTEIQSASQESDAGKMAASQLIRELELHCNSLMSEIESAKARLGHLDESEKEQSSIQLRMDIDGHEWEEEKERNQGKIAHQNDCMKSINLELDKDVQVRDDAKAIFDEKVGALDRIRDEIKHHNNRLHDYTRRIHEFEMKREHSLSTSSNIKERIFESYEINLDDSELDFQREVYNPDTIEDEIIDLKDSLKKIGNVNTGAREDYEQEKENLQKVQTQFDDLQHARTGLKKAIRKLDRIAREQFIETFKTIQTNFQDVFSTLFEGGQARLSLEEDADPLDAKIEINASPSGKKMRGVSLLSGGERALTSISLLFALYLVRTSPYCIMDEVDGPLDDANIGRFINLLRRFSNKTQFLVVTHNKRTMAASDTLYGVTQEIKGISKLVSVRLDEASLISA